MWRKNASNEFVSVNRFSEEFVEIGEEDKKKFVYPRDLDA